MLYRCGPSGSYLNMDINVHAFGYMARSGLQSIFRDFQDFILSVGFTVESLGAMRNCRSAFWAASI